MRKLLFIPIFSFCICLYGQKLFPPSTLGQEIPAWATEMYKANPNVWEVDKGIREWALSHPGEKTNHTQFYKKWRRAIRDKITQDGYIHWPTPVERLSLQNEFRQIRYPALPEFTLPPGNWTCIGPFETGWDQSAGAPASWQVNVYSLDQSLSNGNILFAGTETAEIFKSTDRGLNWTPVSRTYDIPSITAIRIHPSNSNIVFAGGGSEIYKTTDGGNTWNSVLSVGSLDPYDIIIHPSNPLIVMAATNRGLYRSTDGGSIWANLYTDKTWDLEFKPGTPATVYCVKNNASTIRCEFFKSTDSGATWTIQSAGWYNSTDPNRSDGGARIATTGIDPNRVYAYLIGESKAGDNGFIGIWKSTDSGTNWTLPHGQMGSPYSCTNANAVATCPFPNLTTIGPTGTYHQGFYNMDIVCSQTNADSLLIGGCSLWRSTDGGATFFAVGGYSGSVGRVHPDIQDMVTIGNEIWVASDGGINHSTDNMQTHTSRKNGITGSDYWGFGSGWNEDVLVGGRYHNGNSAWHEAWLTNTTLRMGGGEAPTGYINPGNARKAYFSDIGGKYVPATINDPIVGFSLGASPNESYYAAHSSEMEFDPRCYNHIYIGKENTLQKSTNSGASFEIVYTFGSTVTNEITSVEVSRSNPSVIYLLQHNFTTNACTLWKSIDAGLSWATLPKPTGNSRVATLAVSPTDEYLVWLSWVQGGNGEKIFRSNTGGLSWTNITSSLLDNSSVQSILPIGGTDDGVYLGTNKTVWYRNNLHSNWQIHATGLPFVISTTQLRPFYRDGKLRMASYGKGIWEAQLFEAQTPVAQPMVDKLTSSCLRDTFYFDDYSMLNHSGASWLWSITGPSAPAYVSNTNARNPKVVFAQPGNYTVSLTVSDGGGQSDTKIIANMVSVSADCAADTVPGMAISLDGNGDFVECAALNLNSNTVTISAWIKPNGAQNDWAAVVFCRGGNSTLGLSVKSNDELRYHWAGGGWGWASGLFVNWNEWNHVAMVAYPDSMILYVNGIAVKNIATLAAEEFDAPIQIGLDNNSNTRCFNGLIDEVCIYNRSLSRNEIREKMHLTRDPLTDPALVAYYQFNELSGPVLDRAGLKHGTLSGNSLRAISTGPFAKGRSFRQSITAPGSYSCPGTGLLLGFNTGTVPNGEIVTSRLFYTPDQLPGCTSWNPGNYWIINNYGTNFTIGPMGFVFFDSVNVDGTLPTNGFQLFSRNFNADGNTWGSFLSNSTSAVSGLFGTLEFASNPNLSQLGQIILTHNTSIDSNQICDGDSILLGGIWQSLAGTYIDSLSGVGGCDSITQIILTVLPSPNPVISLINDTLFSNESGTYQWYLNGNSIAGATNAQHHPLTPGAYYVVVTGMNGCDKTSASYYYQIAGLQPSHTQVPLLSPNPVSNISSLKIETWRENEMTLEIMDSKGALVLKTKITKTGQVQLKNLAKGLYPYRIYDEVDSFTGRIMLE